jgi:hypothetical protein
MMADTNLGKTSSAQRNSGRNPKLNDRNCHIWKRVVSKSHRTTAVNLTAELNIHLEDPVPTKTVRLELHQSNIHSRVAIANPPIAENSAKDERGGVMFIKPGCQMVGNT